MPQQTELEQSKNKRIRKKQKQKQISKYGKNIRPFDFSSERIVATATWLCRR